VPGHPAGLLDDLFPRREAAKQAGDAVGGAIHQDPDELLLRRAGHQCLPVLQPGPRQFHHRLRQGILLWSKRWFEQAGFQVLYGDTDSLFVGSGSSTAPPPPQQGLQLAAALNEQLTCYIRERWGVLSRLELEFEKTYLRLLLPQARHSTRGASKRYAGLLQTGDISHVEFVGMEVVRSDWTALAKQVQRELYQRLFTDQPVDVYLSDIVKAVRDGAWTTCSCIARACAKARQPTPPPRHHTSSPRASHRRPRARGSAGSHRVRADHGRPRADRQYSTSARSRALVRKQVRPVAEPVLATLGLDFDSVIGDGRQGRSSRSEHAAHPPAHDVAGQYPANDRHVAVLMCCQMVNNIQQ